MISRRATWEGSSGLRLITTLESALKSLLSTPYFLKQEIKFQGIIYNPIRTILEKNDARFFEKEREQLPS